jgi:predicted nucleic acid-binding protein
VIVVSDTSAITSLLQIGRIGLLASLYDEVVIPGAVERELRRTHKRLPDFIRTVPVVDPTLSGRFVGELDAGESEAIALMLEGRGDLLLMDERKGRRVAKRAGIQVIGLLGVLLDARQAGLLKSISEVVTELEQIAGFRISKELKERLVREEEDGNQASDPSRV